MSGDIEYYFDFSSPYGYLASHRIDELAARHGRGVEWKAYLLGAAFKVSGERPLVHQPPRGSGDDRVHGSTVSNPPSRGLAPLPPARGRAVPGRKEGRAPPGAARKHHFFARKYQRQEDPEPAAFHFEAALRYAPRSAEIHHDYGRMLGAYGMLKEAEEHFLEALASRPEFTPARESLKLIVMILRVCGWIMAHGRFRQLLSTFTKPVILIFCGNPIPIFAIHNFPEHLKKILIGIWNTVNA